MDNPFLEYIESKLGIKKLIKVENVEVSTSINELEMTILYDDNKKDIFYKVKDIITGIIKEYVGNEYKVNITYRKSFLDKEYLNVIINRKIQEFNLKIINEKNVRIEQKGTEFLINLDTNLTENFAKTYIKKIEDLINELPNKYFYTFSFNVHYSDKLEIEDFSEEEQQEIINISQNSEDEFIEITDKQSYIGKIIEDLPIDLAKIKSATDYVVLCGECSKFQKKEFQKEKIDKETNEKIQVNSYRYAFKITFLDNSISCTYFPKANEKEKEFNIEDGKKILVDGKIDNYNGNLTLKVKNVNYCNYEEKRKEKEKIFLPIPKRYTKIFPEPFESQEQMDIFSMIEEKEQKDIIKNKKYVVFDLETTGLSSDEDSITEISAIKIENGKMTECFNSFINPEKPIPEEVVKLTNITDEMVKNAPKANEMIGDFLKFSEGCVLVAHNISFDIGFLNKIAYKCSYKIENEQDDSLALARKKLPMLKNHKLKTVADYLKVSLVGAHRAINDTLATAKVYLKLLEMD